MIKAIPMEDWLRGCIYHDGRHGYVTLPCDKVHQIANYIQRTRRSGMDGLIDLEVVKADRKTENSSEKPNNCEHITEDGVTCAKYPACDDCLDNPLNKVKGSERLVKGKDEPQKKEVEWVYNKRERLWYPYSNGELLFKDEPTTQTETQNSNKNSNVISVYDGVSEAVRCAMCSNPNKSDRGCDGACSYDEKLYERIMKAIAESVAEDEPQTDYKMPYKDCEDCETHLKAQMQAKPKDEPQTEDKEVREVVRGFMNIVNDMRNPTEEEKESVNKYIESISKPTGANVFELMDEPQMGDAKPIPLSNRVTHIEDEPQTDCAWK